MVVYDDVVQVGSLPLRERGLKFGYAEAKADKAPVAPLAGAWIEIYISSGSTSLILVAPLAGAWIEIYSPPYISNTDPVAPLAGAWIEIYQRCDL